MGKVRMRSVHDGNLYEFDAGRDNEVLRKAISSGDWTQELNTGQQIVKGVSDWAPAIGAGVGAVAGATGGGAAGLPLAGVGAIPGAAVGGAAGGLQGALLGASARELGYGAAGIMKDDRLGPMAGRFAAEGAQGILTGLGQGVGSQPHPAIAESMMKRAVGNAQPEIEREMVARGIPVSPQGRVAAQKAILAAKAEKKALLEWASGPDGVRVSWKHIRETLANAARRASEADPISVNAETALNHALKIARYKSRQFITQALRAGQRELPANEDAVLTPAQIERIRRNADNHVAYYEKIRMGTGNSTPSAEPSPMEGAYKMIADRMRTILNEMRHPATGRSLEDINREIGTYSDIHRTVTKALARGHGRDLLSAGAGASLSAAPALWSHDPMRAMVMGIPGAAVGYATSNPQLLSQGAVSLARPSMVRGAFGQVPGQAAGLAARLMGISDPSLKPSPLPDDLKPDYMK